MADQVLEPEGYKRLPALFDLRSNTTVGTDALIAIAIAGTARVTDLAKRRGLPTESMYETLLRFESRGLVRKSAMNSPIRSRSFALNDLHPAYNELRALLVAMHTHYQVANSPSYALHQLQYLNPPIESKLDQVIGRPPVSRALMLVAMLGEVQMAHLLMYANVPITARPNFLAALHRWRALGILQDRSAAGILGARHMIGLSQSLPVHHELRALLRKLGDLLGFPTKLAAINDLYERQLASAKSAGVSKSILMHNRSLFITSKD